MFIEKELLTKIYAKLDIDEETMCWWYTGSTNGKGYGRTYHKWEADKKGRNYGVHRLMYEVFHGPIPENREVHHICGVRNCCNPAHLAIVSHRENVAWIGQYEELRWRRLQDLLAMNFDLALFGLTHVTSRDLSTIWGKSCRGGNLVSYLRTLAFVFGEDFQWSLIKRGAGRRPHLFEIRMTPELIERVEAFEDNASQPTLDSITPMTSLAAN